MEYALICALIYARICVFVKCTLICALIYARIDVVVECALIYAKIGVYMGLC
jgi:hypothetical protein